MDDRSARALFADGLAAGDDTDDDLQAPSFPSVSPLPSQAWPAVLPHESGASAAGLPRFVAGYEILGVLGKGGMGVVYKARQLSLNRLVALKRIHPQFAGGEERARFRAEAESAARLQHPNVVQIYEVGEDGGLPFFSLELVEGGSLDRRLDGTPQAPAAAARLVRALALAMQAAHDKGVIHRDLKPANVLLLADGTPKITDFGLAKYLYESSGHTQPGAVLGTPSYMAPEQADSRRGAVGPWSDVYALGAILYEMLTGRPPFRGATVLDTIEQVRGADPVPPHRLNPKAPADLETVCLKCLHKDPARRYGSAAELAEDLQRWLDGEPVRARPAGPLERLLKWGRRRPTAAALLAVSLLTVAALAVAVPWVILRLETELDRGRDQGARQERDLKIAHRKIRFQDQLRAGEKALARGGPDELGAARERFAEVRDQISDAEAVADDELAQLRAEAGRRFLDAQRSLDDLAAGAEAPRILQEFFRGRDEAFFLLHRDRLTGSDPASPEASRQAARAALALFGQDDFSAATPAPDLSRYPPREQERLRTGLHEVALMLAEATAHCPAGADADVRRRRADEALAVLDAASGRAPPTHAAHLYRARYLEQRGDAAAAGRERAAAAQLPPRSALDWFLAGQDHFIHSGDPRAALADFDRALRLEPDLFWAQFLRALAWQQLRNPAEARAALGVCVRERPDFVWSYLLRGLLNGQAGDFAAAEDDFARAAELARDDSSRYVLHVHRGLVALLRGRVQPAIDDLRQAVRLKPELYPGHVNLAQGLVERQDLDGAVAAMTEALRLEPRRPELFRTRARMQLLRHDSTAARRDLDEAIRLGLREGPSPALAHDLFERGLLQHQGGSAAEAARDCAAALDLAPDLAPAWRLYGEVLGQQGRWREALKAFDRYIALDRGAPDAEVFLQRARARVELGDFTRLPAEYERAVELRPHADVHAALGWAHVVNEALPLARRDFDDALGLDAHHADALTGRGLVRALSGDWRRGVDDAEAGLRHGAPTARLLYNAARVYAQAAASADPAAAELRSRYELKGVRLLADALGHVPVSQQRGFWRDNIEQDRVLAPLKGCPAFARLAATFAVR